MTEVFEKLIARGDFERALVEQRQAIDVTLRRLRGEGPAGRQKPRR